MTIKATPIFNSAIFDISLTPEELEIFSCWKTLNDDDFVKNIDSPDSSTTEVSKEKYVLEKFLKQKQKLLSLFSDVNDRLLLYENEFKITTSWFTRAKPGTYSQIHNHKNSFYSGVLYFGEYDYKSAPIEFVNFNSDSDLFFMDPKEYTIYNSRVWKITPNSGSLLFFPSYVYHRIGVNNSSNTRYSLAFNLIPVGKVGIGDSRMDIDIVRV